jgi:NADPH-dependent ferric siderophore reductase
MPGDISGPGSMEVTVHPYLVSLLAAEHVCDMRTHAAAARRARWARRARRGQTVTISAAGSMAGCRPQTVTH